MAPAPQNAGHGKPQPDPDQMVEAGGRNAVSPHAATLDALKSPSCRREGVGVMSVGKAE
jgi:hypothetical protein